MSDWDDLDAAFDAHLDTPKGKDPDSFSPTLRRYRRLLWGRALPSGRAFDLEDTSRGRRQRRIPVATRPRLALTLLLAAASVVAPSRLLAQLRPLGEEVVVAMDQEPSACPAVAARDDGSVVVLRADYGELRSVVLAADGSLGSDHLLAEGTSLRGDAVDGVTATADGFLAAWRLPDVYPDPYYHLPGAHAGVGLDTAGAATSTPRALHHAYDRLSPRPTGGYAATTPFARRFELDLADAP